MKRKDYISWDEYFMGIRAALGHALQGQQQPGGGLHRQPENKILSLGYNGMPIGCNDDDMPWEREGDPLETKYMYVCHAELNAILNSAHSNSEGARVYVTLFPCNECAKAIIQSGIKEIIYYSDKYHGRAVEHRQPQAVQHDRRQIPCLSSQRPGTDTACVSVLFWALRVSHQNSKAEAGFPASALFVIVVRFVPGRPVLPAAQAAHWTGFPS